MKIDPEKDEVTLTDNEQDVATHVYYLQTQGHARVPSIEEALTYMHGKPTKRFVEWLSDGQVTVTKGEVQRVEPAEADTAQEQTAEAVNEQPETVGS